MNAGKRFERGCYHSGNRRPRRLPLQRQRRNIVLRAVEKLPMYAEVRDMLTRGDPIDRVVRVVKNGGYWTELSDRAVWERLSNYKRLVLFKSAVVTDVLQARSEQELREGVEMALDEVAEMEELFRLQKGRIEKFKKQEDIVPIPIKHIDEAMRVALMFLQASSSLKVDLGLSRPKGTEGPELSVDTRVMALVEGRYGRESLSAVMADPKSRARVASIAASLLEKPQLQEALRRRMEAAPAGPQKPGE